MESVQKPRGVQFEFMSFLVSDRRCDGRHGRVVLAIEDVTCGKVHSEGIVEAFAGIIHGRLASRRTTCRKLKQLYSFWFKKTTRAIARSIFLLDVFFPHF